MLTAAPLLSPARGPGRWSRENIVFVAAVRPGEAPLLTGEPGGGAGHAGVEDWSRVEASLVSESACSFSGMPQCVGAHCRWSTAGRAPPATAAAPRPPRPARRSAPRAAVHRQSRQAATGRRQWAIRLPTVGGAHWLNWGSEVANTSKFLNWGA